MQNVYIEAIDFTFRFEEPIWIISQFFAAIAFFFTIWAWQVSDKVKVLLLVGIFSTALAISATLLANFTLGVLFGLAAVRNFVFCYIDWKDRLGAFIPKWVRNGFAALFIILTVGATVLLVHIIQVPTYGAWLEWMICITLIGLVIGNIQTGTNLMRVSFIANRVFNIINHIYFNNAIAVFIALAAIGSNVVYYLRVFVAWLKALAALVRKVAKLEEELERREAELERKEEELERRVDKLEGRLSDVEASKGQSWIY